MKSILALGLLLSATCFATTYKPYVKYQPYNKSPEGVNCKALVKSGSPASECAGTKWFCEKPKNHRDYGCQKTQAYCESFKGTEADNPNCDGTEARCRNDVNNDISNVRCNGTKVYCEKYPERSECMNLPVEGSDNDEKDH